MLTPKDMEAREMPSDRETAYCPRCDGRRYVIDCIDDMCRGAGECRHGDGESDCPLCNIDGALEWEID